MVAQQSLISLTAAHRVRKRRASLLNVTFNRRDSSERSLLGSCFLRSHYPVNRLPSDTFFLFFANIKKMHLFYI